MGQALYRKYRSRTFDEVAGQDHIVKILKNTLKSGKISHAYLFSGPKGVGKTSVARILAHEVNQLPYIAESVHLDIIEIDAASNRRIDEIRDLRERVRIAPTSAKYKVYIIDEVHMLTREAFNALLKTLEEPPAHCIFILATTEAHKLPETIISRTQHFNFKPVDNRLLASHLSKIAKKERINIEPEALDLLAEHGEGSFRDGIGLLDQLSGSQDIVTVADIQLLLGLPPLAIVEDLLKALETGDSRQLIKTLDIVKGQPINPAALAAELGRQLRERVISGTAAPPETLLMRNLLEIPSSAQPYELLEISLLEAVATQQRTPEGSQPPPESPRPNIPQAKSPNKDKSKNRFTVEQWPEVIKLVKNRAASLYTALRLATPELNDDTLVLKFQFPLHQKKIDQAPVKNLIGQLIEDTYGSRLTIACLVDKSAVPTAINDRPVEPELDANTHFQSISNIFGAAEVLES